MVCAALLRFNNIDGPVGGYHAMNEAQYIMIAHNFNHVSLLRPTGFRSEQDIKIRALYVYTVYAASKVFGESPATARGVSAAAGLAAVMIIFAIGFVYGGPRAGVAAAAFLAVSPIHVTLSRNAQPDALCSALCLLCVLSYMISERAPERAGRMIVTGFIWGAAVFTKNFALLLLPCVVLNELVYHRRRMLRRVALFTLPGVLVVSPFLIYQLATNAGGTAYMYRSIVLDMPGATGLRYLFRESFWALSPGVSAAAAAAFIYLAATGLKKYTLPLSCAAVFAFQYLLQHSHSYYFLSAAPFLMLLAGIALSKTGRAFYATAAPVITVTALAYTLLFTAAVKHNFTNFSEAAEIIKSTSTTGTILASPGVYNNAGPVVSYYLPRYTLLEKEKVRALPGAFPAKLDIKSPRPYYFLEFALPDDKPISKYQRIVNNALYGIRAFNFTVALIPSSWHSFIPQKFKAISDEGNFFDIGYSPVTAVKALIVSRAPDGTNVYIRPDGDGKFVYIIQ